MLEIIQWFDDRDRFVGLVVFMAVLFWGLASIARGFAGKEE